MTGRKDHVTESAGGALIGETTAHAYLPEVRTPEVSVIVEGVILSKHFLNSILNDDDVTELAN